jgi:ADP-ribose pyrophosphatase YjhB (NUDIX family)/nicotinamide mononucleotide adenylyltransferase
MNIMETAIIVARFQISSLHDGQKHLIDTVVSKHKRIIIFLGLTPIKSRKNPLNYKNREIMVKSLYPNVEVYPLYDHKFNSEWVENLERNIKELVPDENVILYGGRDSCIETYVKSSGKYKTVLVSQNKDYNATELRDEISKECINSDDFRKGIIYAQYNNVYPTAFSTVDIITTRYNNNELEILLGQKSYEVGKNFWRLPGGFIDPSDEYGRDAASRELREETTINASPSLFQIIEQVKIRDWRYNNTEHSIMTTIYSIHINSGWNDKIINSTAHAGDDLEEVKWFKFNDLNLDNDVTYEHRNSIQIFINSPYYEYIKNIKNN